VESAPGQGATFRVYLPRVEEELSVERSVTPSRRRAATETILVVEDDSAAAALVAEVA
jgi:hypothetical protein